MQFALLKLRHNQLKFNCNNIHQLADGGSIVFCSGALSRRPGKGSTALAAANAALEAAGRGLANDLGPR
jgi:NAD(P)-dependent dehydrogenase (short-subunit alcohol dehydrogenase family)